jgi:hypothetical protein
MPEYIYRVGSKRFKNFSLKGTKGIKSKTPAVLNSIWALAIFCSMLAALEMKSINSM